MFALRDRDRGLGDVRLTADCNLQGAPDATRGLVLRSGLKLPTRSSDTLRGSGSVGLSRPVWLKLSARLQLDGHSAFYDSELRPLGASSVQLTFGGSVELAHAQRLDFAMVQNLFTDTTPDLGIHLAWRGGY